MANAKPKPHYGWAIVIAGFFVSAAGIGVFNNTLSVFIKPVTEALGFSRGAFTLYNTFRNITAMLMMPVFGELYRRGNIRRVMFLCTLLIAVAPVGYSLSSKLWHFYLFAVVHGAASNGLTTMAVSSLINNWFEKKKGFATGLALSGSGLGGALMVPLLTGIVERAGWRWGYRAMGLIGVAVLLPLILIVLRNAPRDKGLVKYGHGEGEASASAAEDSVGFTRAEAFRMPGFYMVFAGFFLLVFVVVSIQGHMLAYLTDLGHSGLFASSVVSANMIALIFGKIALGFIFDRFGILVGSLTAGTSITAAGICLLMAEAVPFAYLGAVLLGFGMAFGSVAPSLITGRYFGVRDYARILAVLTMGDSLGNAMSQPFPGFVYDFAGSYIPAWYICIGLMLLSVALLVGADRLVKLAWDRRIAKDACTPPEGVKP